MSKNYLYLIIFGLTLQFINPSPGSAQKEQWIEGAKKEGEVVFWTFSWQNADMVLKPFYERYPFLKVKVWDSRNSTIINKLITEAKAGRFSPDVLILGTDGLPLLQEAGLLRENDRPAHVKRWPDQPAHNYWFNYAIALAAPTYNTKVISRDEAPRSWADINNPKWRGKSVISSSAGDTPFRFAHMWRQKGGQLDWDRAFAFWDEVIKNTKPMIERGYHRPNELHAAGNYPLFLVNALAVALTYIEKGAPIRIVPVGRIPGRPWGLAMPKTVPHPNSAQLFVDYLLSVQGAVNYADALNISPLNPDAAKQAKVNGMLKKAGIDWYLIPNELLTTGNIRKTSKWWASTLGLRRGKKKKR